MAQQFPFDLERTARRASALRDEKARILGSLIRQLRERDNKSREDIAEAAGISVGVLFRLENGLQPFDEIDEATLRAIAKGMGEVLPSLHGTFSVHSLCGGAGFTLEELRRIV